MSFYMDLCMEMCKILSVRIIVAGELQPERNWDRVRIPSGLWLLLASQLTHNPQAGETPPPIPSPHPTT